MGQTKLTAFLQVPKAPEPPKRMLLKSSGIKGMQAELSEEGKVTLTVEHRGMQRLIAILTSDQFKALMAIPPMDLSPKALQAFLPKIPETHIFLLNEALLKIYREAQQKNRLY